jgi:tight adherence protein C
MLATSGAGLVPKLMPVLSLVGKWVKAIPLGNYRANLQEKIVTAGNPHGICPDELVALKLVSAVSFIILFSFIPVGTFALRFLLALLAFFLPDLWLRDLIQERRKKIVRILPGFIDLLTLAVEAGMDFMAALNQVISLSTRDPLVDEFRYTLEEIKLGTSREDALRNMGERINLQELTTFISSLIQANRLGTPLGKVLRIQSEEIRKRRMLRAEKMGQEASVKIILPLVAFIFPCVLIILLGPLFIQMMQGGF